MATASTSKIPSSKTKARKRVGFKEFSPLEAHKELNEDNDELTEREKLQNLIKKKKQCDAQAQNIVLHLIETGIEKSYLLENAWLIAPNHWEDIVEERKLSKLCGWVLCDNSITNIPRQQFSIRRNQVFDITERKSFCSPNCYAISNHFKEQLLISPLWLRHKEPIPEFEILEDKTVELHGLDLRLNKLDLEPEHEDEDTEEDDDDDNNKEEEKKNKHKSDEEKEEDEEDEEEKEATDCDDKDDDSNPDLQGKS